MGTVLFLGRLQFPVLIVDILVNGLLDQGRYNLDIVLPDDHVLFVAILLLQIRKNTLMISLQIVQILGCTLQALSVTIRIRILLQPDYHTSCFPE